MSALPKPVLRGHTQRKGLGMIFGAVLFSGATGALFYFFHKLPKERAYDEFIKTYDAQAHYELLAKYGYLQSTKVNKD